MWPLKTNVNTQLILSVSIKNPNRKQNPKIGELQKTIEASGQPGGVNRRFYF